MGCTMRYDVVAVYVYKILIINIYTIFIKEYNVVAHNLGEISYQMYNKFYSYFTCIIAPTVIYNQPVFMFRLILLYVYICF